ncbi:Na-Ca-ex domain-containing protein [Mycena kentingensis (nom. inval.)]|nr:Na-Ca-ex domain-containing protein [Mycena kentingensis (nom. inval.)]
MPARTLYYPGSPASTSAYPMSPTYPSSPAAFSPPPLNHSRSPYACTPLPPLQGECILHWALDAQSSASLKYDVSRDPSAHSSPSPTSPSPRVLAEPAISLALPCLTILVAGWRIPVYPSSRKPGACVTVADMLHAVYRALRQHVSWGEAAEIPRDALDAARFMHQARCRGLERIHTDEPLRRIDFLYGRRQFGGLVRTPESPDVWLLSVT